MKHGLTMLLRSDLKALWYLFQPQATGQVFEVLFPTRQI